MNAAVNRKVGGVSRKRHGPEYTEVKKLQGHFCMSLVSAECSIYENPWNT